MKETENMKVNAAHTDPQDAPAADPLAPFYKVANALLDTKSKDLAQAISMIYGSLSVLLDQGTLTGPQLEQLMGSFVIAYVVA